MNSRWEVPKITGSGLVWSGVVCPVRCGPVRSGAVRSCLPCAVWSRPVDQAKVENFSRMFGFFGFFGTVAHFDPINSNSLDFFWNSRAVLTSEPLFFGDLLSRIHVLLHCGIHFFGTSGFTCQNYTTVRKKIQLFELIGSKCATVPKNSKNPNNLEKLPTLA